MTPSGPRATVRTVRPVRATPPRSRVRSHRAGGPGVADAMKVVTPITAADGPLDDALIQFATRVPPALLAAVHATAQAEGVRLQAWIADALRCHLTACQAEDGPATLAGRIAEPTAAPVQPAGQSGGDA
jgi:hypothetical protein